jgi:oxygen-independent coproporphyrinogen-3 oxidase
LLPARLLQALMSAIRSNFNLVSSPEITLEANPDDLSQGNLDKLREAGINRLSIGVQSFQDNLLNYLHRAHSAEVARRCLIYSREAGFQNISLDLIYAIPGLDAEMWKATLLEALSFRPEHISAYALTIEDRTVFGNWKKKGKLRSVSDDEAAVQFEIMQEVLGSAGYEQYEISNFALTGFQSRHNTSYWLQKPYLGIGPSAHSFDGKRRIINVRSNAGYAKAIAAGAPEAEIEELTEENKANEYILTRLRTKWGCDMHTLRDTLGYDLLAGRGVTIQRYQELGLLDVSDNILLLTKKGMLLADRITEDLMKG